MASLNRASASSKLPWRRSRLTLRRRTMARPGTAASRDFRTPRASSTFPGQRRAEYCQYGQTQVKLHAIMLLKVCITVYTCSHALSGYLFIPMDTSPHNLLCNLSVFNVHVGLSVAHLVAPQRLPTAGGWMVSWADGWYTPSCRHVSLRPCCSPLDILHTSE